MYFNTFQKRKKREEYFIERCTYYINDKSRIFMAIYIVEIVFNRLMSVICFVHISDLYDMS